MQALTLRLGASCRLRLPAIIRPALHLPMAVEQHRDKRLKTAAAGPDGASGTAVAPKPPAPKKKKKSGPKASPPPPTRIPAGVPLPEDLTAWDNAVLLIDKPKGWTSFDVCGKLRGSLAALLRRRSKEIKVGHAGTLDPMATGLLIVCVGKGTKSIDSFVAMTKEYSGVLRLGEGTPSYDADAEVDVTRPWAHLSDADLAKARDGLLGEIDQVPPMFSAIRVGGKRLYEAAREGKEVERAARRVTVDRFDLERDSEESQDVRFYVVCSKGTYVRSLAHDLGEAAGTAAHLTALRREAIGEYRVDNAWGIEELAERLREQRDQRRAVEEAAAAAAAAETEDSQEGVKSL